MPVSGIDESEPRRARLADGRVAWIDEPARSPSRDAFDRQPQPGRDDARAGRPATKAPPLVLIHGFMGHRDDFIGVAPRLALGRRVIAPDLRGHGDSEANPGPFGWSFEQLVKDLLGLLDHLEIERCDLLGHSMGGMLTLRFALAHPERIRSLLFMCTAPELPTTLGREGFERGAELAETRGMAGLQEIMEKVGRLDVSETIAAWGERYWAHHRRRLCAMTPESFRGIGTMFFDSTSLVERLPEIDVPVRVMVGEFDEDWLPGADLFEAHLPRVERTTIPRAEHHPHQENPERWFESVTDHLEGLGPIG